MALRRGRLGICVLVQVPAVPMPKDLSGAVEFGIRLIRRPWFVQGCLLRQGGEAGDPGVRSTLGEGVYAWKEEIREEANDGEGVILLFLKKGGREKKDEAAT